MVYNEVAEDEKQGKEGMNMNPVIVRNVRSRRGDAEDLCPGRGKNEGRDQGSGGLCGAEPEMSGAGYIDMVDVEMFQEMIRCRRLYGVPMPVR